MAKLRLIGAFAVIVALAALLMQGVPPAAMFTLLKMRLFPADQFVQIQCCEELKYYGFNRPETKTPLMLVGAQDLIMKAVRRFPDDFRVQLDCLVAISSNCLFNQRTSEYAGELGAVEFTARAFRKWGTTNKQMVMGGTFGCFNDFAPQNRMRMLRAGGVKLMLDACGINGSHYGDADAQFSVWCGFSSFHLEETHEEFRRLGGIESMTAVMRDHGKSYRVREEVLQCSKGMAGFVESRVPMVDKGYLDAVLAALDEDLEDPHVQALGFDTLRMLVEVNATVRGDVVKKGGIELAMRAMKRHSGKLKDVRGAQDPQQVYGELNDIMYNVPGATCETLSALALDGPTTHRKLYEAGAVELATSVVESVTGKIPETRARHGACAMFREMERIAEGEVLGRVRQALANNRCAFVPLGRPPVNNNYKWVP